jgi:formylglycine-generating enzyme required for sulfatase activity
MATATPEPALTSRWRQAQQATDDLWRVVQPAAMYERPVPERHRLIFYLGHLEAFDWNLLAPALELKPFHPEWDRLFSFGIDPVDGQLPQDQPRDWPRQAEIEEYNRHIRRTVEAALPENPEDELATRVQVAIEHRWMHAETLCYLFHNLPYEAKSSGPAPPPNARPPRARTAESIESPAGTATLGQQRGHGFGWDNEFDRHTVAVPAFATSRFKVSNGDYLKFVADGAAPPLFWHRHDGQWWYRGMFGEVPLPLDAPVYVTHAEAQAYAAWAGQTLPTEAQWHRMAYGTPNGEERGYPWGDEPIAPSRGNLDFAHWDPTPAHAHPQGASAWGVEDLLGNGWEWTSTPFAPFAGFTPMPFYPGYSANFFDGQHYVIKGASARTAACLARRSFRNWFQPHYPYVYTGFRCVSRPNAA